MKIYIATRMSRKKDALQLASYLITKGHTVTSRWLYQDHDVKNQTLSFHAKEQKYQEVALMDIEDIIKSDIVISLTEEPRGSSRGGRHVEFGFALAKGKMLFVIGPKEHAFHRLPEVNHYQTTEQFLATQFI